MTHSVLADLASQREEQMVARTRRHRLDPETTVRTTVRTARRDRTRVAARLSALVGR
jgi:hypothetical protein